MNKLFLTLLVFFSCFYASISRPAYSGPGDTITVQTFTYGSPLEGKFLFPDSTHQFRKIWMYYKLKCNPAQNPACGEWDYLTYTYVYKHTGKYDSTLYWHSNFTVNGTTPDTLEYMDQTSWKYIPWFEFFNATVPLDTTFIGSLDMPINHPFSASVPDARSLYLFRSAELLAMGLDSGAITGLRFHFTISPGNNINRLTLRMKHTTQDTVSQNLLDNSGFTEVFQRSINFSDTGWQTIPFTYPFTWDGMKNLLVDVSYESKQGIGIYEVHGNDAGFVSSMTSSTPDWSLDFEDLDCVKIPESVVNGLDSAVTIAFWVYGDPLLQPQNDMIFEGTNTQGERVMTVHLPWGDSHIYWDAGRDSSGYDRTYQQCNEPSMWRGKWNHWAFTKDLKTMRMRIYFNGNIWGMGAQKKKRMTGITSFRIGSNGAGNDMFYDGMIDEFCIWNKALTDTSIRKIMYGDITPLHPDYGHLLAYYQFNDGSGYQSSDSGPFHQEADNFGFPTWQSFKGTGRFRNMVTSSIRPAVVFEQGIYDPAALDSSMKIDTIARSPMMIVLFEDTLKPNVPTDTLVKWPVYYDHYTYNQQGQAIDSTRVDPDGVLYREDHSYYGEPFELVERYEIGRYITPYGNGLDLGDGFTWIYDVTDYATLLRDSVHLAAGNWQELLDLKFLMIEGTPPREVLKIRNIYTGLHGYDNPSAHNLPPVTLFPGASAVNLRLKMRITGHGFGGNLNCSEFCPRINKLLINGNQEFTHRVWRDDCVLNPLYPQGGTWLYNRAEWCPGAEVRTTDFEITPFHVPNDSLTIDYDLQEGYTWNGQGSWPYYVIESQLISYGQPNFLLNAAIEEIISPNNHELYNRFNPMCGKPVIAIKNNGSIPMTSAEILYGPSGGETQLFVWTGNLAFQDTARITLPSINWSGFNSTDRQFFFTLNLPNGGQDEDLSDNYMESTFEVPPTYNNVLVFHFKTNHLYYALSWALEDELENILYQNGSLEENTVYIDTFHLDRGCYRLVIRNAEGEGLQYWANMPPYGNGTAGYARIFDLDGNQIKVFKSDFGAMIGQSFTVGMTIEVPDLYPGGYFEVFPNPSDGLIHLDFALDQPQVGRLEVLDVHGKLVYVENAMVLSSGHKTIDLSGQGNGIYLIRFSSGHINMTRKVLINR